MAKVHIRPAKYTDIEFIYSTWLRCYKHSSPATKYIRKEIFFPGHQRFLDQLLSKPEVKVLVACDPSDENLLFGFLAYEPKILHFIYIKKPFRKEGVMTELLKDQGIDLSGWQSSHVTYDLVELWIEKKWNVPYNPYLGGIHG